MKSPAKMTENMIPGISSSGAINVDQLSDSIMLVVGKGMRIVEKEERGTKNVRGLRRVQVV